MPSNTFFLKNLGSARLPHLSKARFSLLSGLFSSFIASSLVSTYPTLHGRQELWLCLSIPPWLWFLFSQRFMIHVTSPRPHPILHLSCHDPIL